MAGERRVQQRAGAGEVLLGGVVAYAAEVKYEVLGVPRGAVVTGEAAQAMAVGARRRLDAELGVAVTGVSGPCPMEGVAVGTVHIGMARGDEWSELDLSTVRSRSTRCARSASPSCRWVMPSMTLSEPPVAVPLEAGVVLDRDAGERRGFLAPQALDPPPAATVDGQSGLLGGDPGPAGGQELPDRAADIAVDGAGVDCRDRRSDVVVAVVIGFVSRGPFASQPTGTRSHQRDRLGMVTAGRRPRPGTRS